MVKRKLHPIDMDILKLCSQRDFNIRQLERELKKIGKKIAYKNLLARIKKLENLGFIEKKRKEGVSGKEAIISSSDSHYEKAQRNISSVLKKRLKKELKSTFQWLDPRTEKRIREYIQQEKDISYDKLKEEFPMIDNYPSLGWFIMLSGIKDKEVEIIFKYRGKNAEPK